MPYEVLRDIWVYPFKLSYAIGQCHSGPSPGFVGVAARPLEGVNGQVAAERRLPLVAKSARKWRGGRSPVGSTSIRTVHGHAYCRREFEVRCFLYDLHRWLGYADCPDLVKDSLVQAPMASCTPSGHRLHSQSSCDRSGSATHCGSLSRSSLRLRFLPSVVSWVELCLGGTDQRARERKPSSMLTGGL